ncbi:MAG: TIGR01906 family membrane protein [Anaerolineae bacterium]|nr:TIGR01906 family membrane protein [Thermoflexales bacterium]MDW8408116.1 TIGR01906 family membrane protein [Anaerolineae bacterium]
MTKRLASLTTLFIIIATPIVAVVIPIRLAMQPWTVPFLYSLPNFPPEAYGMSDEERLRLGQIGMDSVIGPRGVDVLREARLSDGTPAFNEREIRHMQDVRNLIGWLFPAHTVISVLGIAAVIVLAARRATRYQAGKALISGAVITAAGVIGLGILAVVVWDVFFTAFHRIFFEGDTWLFLPTDTLIRLYPELFWFTITLMIGGFILIECLALAAIGIALRKPGGAVKV